MKNYNINLKHIRTAAKKPLTLPETMVMSPSMLVETVRHINDYKITKLHAELLVDLFFESNVEWELAYFYGPKSEIKK